VRPARRLTFPAAGWSNSPDGEVSGTVTVAAASIDTSSTRRDEHLRSADFFDTANNPDSTFTADGIRPSGQGVMVTGALRHLPRPLPAHPRRLEVHRTHL
jgi:YceI-like domain